MLVAVLHIAVLHNAAPGLRSERLSLPHGISVVRMNRGPCGHHWGKSLSLGHSDRAHLFRDLLLLSEGINEGIKIILYPDIGIFLLLVHSNVNGFGSFRIDKLILFES